MVSYATSATVVANLSTEWALGVLSASLRSESESVRPPF